MGEGYLCGMESGYEDVLVFADYILHTIRERYQSYQILDVADVHHNLSTIIRSHYSNYTIVMLSFSY